MHGTIFFTNLIIVKESIQKYLGLFLDIKLNILAHISGKIKKTNKSISIIKKLSPAFYHVLH